MPRDKVSIPPYQPSGNKHHSNRHRHSELMSNPAFSYHPADTMLHFYRWSSPPGVMKILCILIIIMCVAVFACVASTLAWDYDMNAIGLGGSSSLLPGYGSSYGGAYGGAYGGSYGGAFGGGVGGSYSGYGGYGGSTQIDPVAGKGFIIAISAITFIAVLIIFVLVVSRQRAAHSSKFYLATIIICAILAFLMIIATIVYLCAVNPTAQSSGSIYYNQVRQLCAQYQNQNQAQGIFLNQYLYHYCVVEPQEAIAIVFGFLVFIALIILLVFAVKTRSSIRRWGRDRILWEEVKVVNDSHSIGEWVKNVSGEPEAMLNDYNDQVGAPQSDMDQMEQNKPLYMPGLFPSIVDEEERLNYKHEFEQDYHEYKRIQVELDNMNQKLAHLDRELDKHPDGSPQFLDAMEQYTRLKNLKKSPDYLINRKQCKYLRSKLSHIKRMISDYDHRP
ncbi:occludin b isoform X2 [Syngnathus acus]|uniref:occludin b isoform X2 n=1 Tax=Syngnathus acus TaxID=161584 RepID=UPI001885E957|nr:occludin b isoform X2 [Syngnathus acus]